MLASGHPVDDPRLGKHYTFQVTPLRRIATPTLKAVFLLFARLHSDGIENLPAERGVILAANHMTNFDVLPMQFVLPRPIFFMGKEELFRSPPMDWFFRQMGGFPVYRGERDEWALSHARKVLERQQVLGIFPEGSRSKGRGLRTAKTGAARLCKSTGSPIVPMAVYGPQFLFRRFPHRVDVHITLGPPIFPDPDETHLDLTDRLMFSLAGMLPPDARGVYAERPPGF